MNKRKIILFLLTLGLASCNGYSSFVKYEKVVPEIDQHFNIVEDNYYHLDHYKTLEYETFSGKKEFISSYRDLYINGTYNDRNASALGKGNLLVIPVCFLDSDPTSLDRKRVDIQNAFFGIEDATTYESVSSYYNKSSYGQFVLDGEVAPWYQFSINGYEIKDYLSDNKEASGYIVGEAVRNYFENNETAYNFDLDEDGYIDMLTIVYDYPKALDSNDLFWAFTTALKDEERYNFNGSVCYTNDWDKHSFPRVSKYQWSSIDFLYTMGNSKVDSHVFSHEMGHIFGLMDYYSQSLYAPTGYNDMMDYNFGDHTGFSKMCLDWVTPKVLTGEGDITLRPFTTSGDLLLIPSSSWNSTPYDEYLLLEYFAPIGLNSHDSKLSFSYQDSSGTMKNSRFLSTFGIKVYHVDARLAYFGYKHTLTSRIAMFDDKDLSNKLNSFRSKTSSSSWCIDFAFTNSEINSLNHPLYHLLEKSGENTFKIGEPAKDSSTLWKVNDTFGIDTFKDFTFYNKEKLRFNFSISSMNPDCAIISFKFC